MNNSIRRAMLIGAIAATGGFLLPQQPAFANPGIATIAGTQSCVMCHLPGQEGIMPRDKPPHGGFNPDGFRIWDLLEGRDTRCQTSTNRVACAVNMVWPNGVPPSPAVWTSNFAPPPPPPPVQPFQPAPSNAPNRLIKFTDQCFGSKTFIVIRWHGHPGRNIDFMIENGHKVHMLVPDDSTYTRNCGQWPSDGAAFWPVPQ